MTLKRPLAKRFLCRPWLLALVVLLTFGRSAACQERPNLVFILADDQRFDQLSCAGHPILQTPHIDDLAAEGTRFTNAFVTTSICAASRATLFTGLYERGHRYTFRTVPLDREFTRNSYPALLRGHGYRTGFVGKFGVGVQQGETDAMFDYFRPLNRSPYFKPRPDGTERHITQISGDLAIEFLQEQSADQPFCLSISFNAPHAEDGDKENHYPWPHVVDGMYDDATIPPPRLGDPSIFESQPDFLQASLNRQRFFWRWDTPEKYQRNMRAYYRMISGVDHVVGRVREALEELGLAENTVVVYSADNGYYLASRGFAGKWSHYEESLRVPLIVHDPRVPASREVDVMALNVDIPATLLELAGVEIPASYQGRSLAEWTSGSSPEGWRTEFLCEHLMHYPEGIPKWEGVRGQRWKYARYFEQEPMYEFLHDLESDPDELENLAGDPRYERQLAMMRRRCDALRDELGGPYSLERFPLARPRNRAARRSARTEPRTAPNVVMIISDDQAWNDYGFMGHPVIRTPRLDQLARESALFRHGYVPTALCRPSLATMITGRYPHDHGITGNDPAIPAGVPARQVRGTPEYRAQCEALISHIERVSTLPGMLGERGYLSHQSGKWWEGNYRRGGFTHGMTHGDPERGGRHGDEGLDIGREGMEPVFRFIDQAGDRPFFLWYAPFLPHTPHNPPERLLAKYRGEGTPEALAKYYAMCEWFDETCGQLIDYLDEKGLRENTLIVYVTDNGWIQRVPSTEVPDGWRSAFAPRSKQSPNEGGVRTPIMLSWPGTIAPAEHDAIVSSIDLAPTILAAAGLEVPGDLPGVDLLPVTRGEPIGRDAIFGESFAHDVADLDNPRESLLYRWCRQGPWKLIVTYDGRIGRYQAVHADRPGAPQLYHLGEDPHERQNVADEHPEIVRQLQARIDSWW